MTEPPRKGGRRTRPGGLPSPWAETVLDAVCAIPAGEVRSYGQLAHEVGGGPRAVGLVLARYGGAVPWWRVVRSDGRLPEGLQEQARERLLAEGVPVTETGQGPRVTRP